MKRYIFFSIVMSGFISDSYCASTKAVEWINREDNKLFNKDMHYRTLRPFKKIEKLHAFFRKYPSQNISETDLMASLLELFPDEPASEPIPLYKIKEKN